MSDITPKRPSQAAYDHIELMKAQLKWSVGHQETCALHHDDAAVLLELLECVPELEPTFPGYVQCKVTYFLGTRSSPKETVTTGPVIMERHEFFHQAALENGAGDPADSKHELITDYGPVL